MHAYPKLSWSDRFLVVNFNNKALSSVCITYNIPLFKYNDLNYLVLFFQHIVLLYNLFTLCK